MANNTKPAKQRFMEKTLVDSSGCLLWLGYHASNGQGLIRANGKRQPVHRYAYELVNGPIPEGLHIDHLCRVPHCVNPRHLEPVTPRINTLRGIGPSAINAQKTHCKKGHALTPDNTFSLKQRPYSRPCRECRRFNDKKRRPAKPFADRERPMAKLTPALVQQIRQEYVPYEIGLTVLAKKYNVSMQLIHQVVTNKIWTWVK